MRCEWQGEESGDRLDLLVSVYRSDHAEALLDMTRALGRAVRVTGRMVNTALGRELFIDNDADLLVLYPPRIVDGGDPARFCLRMTITVNANRGLNLCA